MALLIQLPLMLAILGQDLAPPEPDAKPDVAARLAYMKRTVAGYDMRPANDPETPFKLQPEAVLRFNNPVGGAKDGAVFLWLGAAGRPEAVAQVSLNGQGVWVHEFSSLSTGPLTATSTSATVWAPTTEGVKFRPVPGAPPPAPKFGSHAVSKPLPTGLL